MLRSNTIEHGQLDNWMINISNVLRQTVGILIKFVIMSISKRKIATGCVISVKLHLIANLTN